MAPLPETEVKTITLTIDDQEVTVPAGTTVLEAARKLGVEDHFGLMPPNYGWWLAKRESIPGFVPSTYGDTGAS